MTKCRRHFWYGSFKVLRRLVIFSLSWLLVQSSAASLVHPAQAAWENHSVVVQLDWKHQYEFAAFYAAKAQGYYRQAGLDVEIREGGPGIDAVAEVLAGRAQFGIYTSGLVVDRAKDQSVVALASLMQHSPVALLAMRSNGINSVHDLAGKPIAVDAHNRDEVEAFLLASGIAKNAINFVPQTDWTLGTLMSGTVAAKVVYSINETFLIRGHEHEYLLLSPRSAGIDLFGNILFTSDAVIQADAAVVSAFKEATLKGLAYALEHPDVITDLILNSYNTQAKSREHLLFEAAQIKELTRPDIVEPGYMSLGRWQHVVDVYASQGQMPAQFDLTRFIYNPQPLHLPVWLLGLIAVLIVGLLAVITVMRRLKAYNQALTQEVAEREQAQSALAISEHNYRELVDNASVIILRMAFDGTITYFNEYAERFFGYRHHEILGRHVMDTIVPRTESGTNRDLSVMVDAILANPDNYQTNENENVTKDGRLVFIQWTNRVILDQENKPLAVLSIGQDITERRRADDKIHSLAFYDALTGLANRRLMLDRLHHAVLQHQCDGRYGALLFIDLDNFKLLNDTRGHHEGDLLLVQVAARLESSVRHARDSVARLGGDEFIVMLEALDEDPVVAVSEAEATAIGLLSALSLPYTLSGRAVHVTASIGVTLFREEQDNVDELLKRADIAMYQAKAEGRNGVRFFDPTMQALVDDRLALDTALRRAISERQFVLHYQPQVDMQGHIVALEALVRWQHPERGVVSPFEFIGLAEETGLIWDVGLQVLDMACAQLSLWQRHSASEKINLSINISAYQFHHIDFVSSVLSALDKHQVDARFMMLEITESLLLKNVSEVIAKMDALKAEGIRFSIDDFGTGYSSLAYLKRLPLDELKIDRSFIMDIQDDDNAAVIVTAFLSLAHLLGLHVVAEGVETTEQQSFLEGNGCDLIQGFLFSRPVSAEQITKMLQG